MEGLVIIRLVALWSLAVNATIPLVQGMTEGTVNTESLKPETVKDAVDLLGKLATDATLKEKFIDGMARKVKEYLDIDDSHDNGYKKKLEKLLDGTATLRTHLLANPDKFGKYASLDGPGASAVVETSPYWLPLLHSEFWFVFFLTTSDGFGIGGSQWSNNFFGSGHTDTKIHKWLTDKLDVKLNIYTMRKGYTDDDLKSGGRATAHFSGHLGIEYYYAGPLTCAQHGLFLLSTNTFYHSNLASVLVFMAEFCRDIKEDKFAEAKNEKYKNIKEACNKLSDNIDSLHKIIWPLHNPEGLTEMEDDDEEGVNRRNKGALNETYKGKLRSDKFDSYVTYMKDNIIKISQLLKQMHSDAAEWSVETLTSGQSHGSFKYGYIFKDNKWDTALYYTVKPYIVKLLDVNTKGSLYSLLECLDSEAAKAGKESMTTIYNILTGKRQASETIRRVAKRGVNPKGGTGTESTSEVTRRTHSEQEQESASGSTKEDVGSNGVPGASGSVNSVAKGPTSGENGVGDVYKATEEEKEGDDGASEEVASEGEKGTKERTSEEPAETPKGETPTKSKSENDPRGINGDNIRLKLARSAEGTEEAVPESPTSATPAVSASTNANEDPAKTGEASHDDQTPQKRRTHSQGDNAPKAIREEAELPSESSFSGIHACGILIVTCIFTVV
ncbi:hypothetical protein BgAZ_401110 [Babesia gibsoni]|uniref:Secreted antigen 1 n=1 Tax=Babesia gibsoni TaxID=33632 RepID=A0AAD8PDF9_BABGI|nr:hypothetical protein BgAZ_401110 [Babesia gibsoni]